MERGNKFNFAEMMRKLDDMYEKEDVLIKDISKIQLELRQIREDKELLQLMIMHQSNKEGRVLEWVSYNKKRS